MSIAALIRNMAAAGAPPEAIAIAVEAIEGAKGEIENRRAADRERKRRQRDMSRDSHGTVTGQSEDSPAVSPALSPSFPPDPLTNPIPTPVSISRTRKGTQFPAPEGVTDEQWQAFVAQRKKKLNDHAYHLLCGKLRTFAEHGWPPGQMIDLAIERGWETVFEPKDFNNGSSKFQRSGQQGTRQSDGFLNAIREAQNYPARSNA